MGSQKLMLVGFSTIGLRVAEQVQTDQDNLSGQIL